MNYGNNRHRAGKRGGKPCIRGMRITVYDVLGYLASGMTYREVLDEFPYLREEDILACLRYVADRERSMLAVERSEAALRPQPAATACARPG